MSTQTIKRTRPSSKTPARNAKKTAKSAKSVKSERSSAKKDAKSARRATASTTRHTSTLSASKTAAKARVKAASKNGDELSAQALQRMIRTLSPPVQPIATIEVPVMAHKYQVGETVYFTSPSFGRAAASGSYIVVKQLPSEGDDHQYRIKSAGEAFERVAKESQLDRV
jgi:hypothetical protein